MKGEPQSSLESCLVMQKLRNLMEFIMVMCTGFVSVVLGAKQIRMAQKHGAQFPDMLDSETFIHGTYIKAAALTRHQLCTGSDESRKI